MVGLSQVALRIGKGMEVRVGDAFQRKHCDGLISFSWRRLLRVQNREGLLAQASPKEGFGFKDPEFPGPIRTGMRKPFTLPVCFVLTSFQITMQEGPVSLIKCCLRVLTM